MRWPDPTRAHPDAEIETMLMILGRAAQALARCGAGDHAHERFRQAIDVGLRLGPPSAQPVHDNSEDAT